MKKILFPLFFSDTIKRFIREAAYHYDENYQACIVSLIVEAQYRGVGYGKKGLKLLIEAAKANGITRLCDNIAIDNPSVTLFLNTGFTEAWRNESFITVELVL